MKKNKENFKGMKKDELEKKLASLREEIRSMNFKSQGARTKNVKEAGALKKQIARVMTEMNKNNTKSKVKNKK